MSDAVLQALPIGLWVTDAAGRLLRAHPANLALWGVGHPGVGERLDLSQWRGWWVHEGQRDRPIQASEWPMARALRGDSVCDETIEILSFHPAPVAHVMRVSAAPLRNASRQIVGGVTTAVDITDRIEAERALRESDRRKDEFLAVLAHELRNPLAPIRAAADLLAVSHDEDERLRRDRIQQASAVIARQVRHLTEMVDDLMDVSRITRGLIRLERAALDIRQVMQDAIEQVRPLAQTRQHRLDLHMPPDPLWVMGDAQRLVQVMTNLLHNAVKYTPSPGCVQITLEAQDTQAVITVQDNGIGMPPELVDTAFELFTQAQRTPDRSQGGLGIGLALVRRIVDLHGGHAQAYSDGVGRGSRLVVTLPRIMPVHPGPDADSAPLPAPAQHQSLKVLVVDDNTDAAQMLALLVETLGHHATVAHSSADALERAAADRPDVCLLDIGLPQVDGYELARRLRAQATGRRPCLVAVTGYSQEQDRERARQAGFDHHLVKPADTAVLARLLDQLVAQESPA